MGAPLRPKEIIATLAEYRVAYVMIGGLAAVLHGSPTITSDADICPDRSLRNLERLAEALRAMHAGAFGRTPSPTASSSRATPRCSAV